MKRIVILSLAYITVAACGPSGTPPPAGPGPEGNDCVSGEYVPFDPLNHEAQDIRLRRIDEMIALFVEAEKDLGSVGAKAASARAIYLDAAGSSDLQAKVSGRKDLHFTDDRRAVGAALDAVVNSAIDDLAAATTVAEVKVAKQRLEKSGFYRFEYLSVVQELFEPSFKHYDEAYGYLGSGYKNSASEQRSLARLAARRDADNQTTLSSELFALLTDGRCILKSALDGRGATAMALGDSPEYEAHVKKLDRKLMTVFAYSVGHELIDYPKKLADRDAARGKVVEAEGFFATLEPYFAEPALITDDGTRHEDLRALGTELRAELNGVTDAIRSNPTTWDPTAFEPAAAELLGKLEKAFGIDVLK